MPSIQESAQEVVNLAQKDNIVVFVWSYQCSIRQAVLELFQNNIYLDYRIFRPYLVNHPKSKNQIVLVSAPTIWVDRSNANAIKDSIKSVHTQLDSRGVKLIIHIWVHDISEPGLLSVHGMSEAWELLKETFKGAVEMDQVSLLLTGWEKVRLEKGVKGMLKIRQALMEDEKNGLLFAWLLVPDRSAAWLVLDDVIELSKVGVDGKRDVAKRILRNDVPGVDETRLVFVQHDIRELCAKLDESAEGQKLREEIQKYFANHQARIEPLLAQIDDEHEIGRKKKQAEATVEHEHLLFRKTMWSFFEAIEKLKEEVPIGRHLQAFYGFNVNPPPPPPPKRLGFFKRLF